MSLSAQDEKKDTAMNELKRLIGQVAKQAKRAAEDGAVHVNHAGRHNIVVTGNVGEPGSTHHASATQTTRIRQDKGGTVEETETTTTTG
jgi:hypothetical protein